MKLAIIPEGPLAFDGKDYLYSEGEVYYLDNIARYFDEVEIYAHAFKKDSVYYEAVAHQKFKSTNINIVELPLRTGKIGKILQQVGVFSVISKNIKKWDAAYIFLPGYSGSIACIISKLFRKKYFAYLASDWPEEAQLLNPWKGVIGKIILPIFKSFVSKTQNYVVRNSMFTLTAGRLLLEKYKAYPATVIETIPRLNYPEFDIYKRADTCDKKQVRLLFVGYLIERKGAQYAIEALKYFDDSYDVKLTIVGKGEYLDELKRLVNTNDLAEKVEFKGHLPNGPQLLEVYRQSDIFIMPSFMGEGFPRVLYEAMSQALPVISTDICGISYKMIDEENALLVTPKDPCQIAEAVKRVIDDGKLRRKIIKGSIEFMERLLADSDGGKQIYNLYRDHLK